MKTIPMFAAIDRQQLSHVSGGAARVAASSKNGQMDMQVQLMLSQLGDSIKDVANARNGSNDMMMPMMMMMMMGGGGGGGSAAPAAAPAPAPPAAQIRVNVRG